MAESRYLRGIGASSSAKVVALGLGLLVQLMAARMMGPDNYGVYTYTFTWLLFIVLFVTRGIDSATVRVVAEGLARDDHGTVRACRAWGRERLRRNVLIVAPVAAGVGYLISELSDVFSWYAFLLLLPALPGMAFSSLNSMTLQGAGQPAGAQVADGIIRPLVTGALLVGIYFVSSPVGAEWAAAATAVACYAAYQWSTIRVRAAIPTIERDVEQTPGSGWNADAGQFFLMSLIALLLARLDLLFIGWFVPASEVGIYGVSARLAELSALALVVSATTMAPMIAGYYSRSELAELQRLLVYSGRLVTLVTLSMFAGLVLLGEWLLDWYGEGFRQGYNVMLILAVGQLINAASGPVGLMLTMTGRVRVALKFYAAAAIGSSLLMVMLVPSFGANGAALATSAGMALWNIGMLIYVVRTMGIDPSMLGFLGNGKDR